MLMLTMHQCHSVQSYSDQYTVQHTVVQYSSVFMCSGCVLDVFRMCSGCVLSTVYTHDLCLLYELTVLACRWAQWTVSTVGVSTTVGVSHVLTSWLVDAHTVYDMQFSHTVSVIQYTVPLIASAGWTYDWSLCILNCILTDTLTSWAHPIM